MRISDWSSDVCSSDLRRHDLGLATDDPALRVARGKGTKRQRLAQRADDPERLNLAMGEHIDLQVTLHGARLPSAEVPQSRDAGWPEKVNKSLRGCLGDRERAISEAAPARSPTRPPIQHDPVGGRVVERAGAAMRPKAHDARGGGSGGADRKSVVSGKRVSVRVDLGGRRIIKNTKYMRKNTCNTTYEVTYATHRYNHATNN